MIVFYHKDHRVCRAPDASYIGMPMSEALYAAAHQSPDDILAWCAASHEDDFLPDNIPALFHHRKMMVSFQPGPHYLNDAIGYVEDSSFLNVNKSVLYPTWLMSPLSGAIHASVLRAAESSLNPDRDFGFFLNSLAKLAMPLGVCCYSAPQLMRPDALQLSQSNFSTLFRFVAGHYRKRWIFLLLLNLIWNDGRWPLHAFLQAIFVKRRHLIPKAFDSINVFSSRTLPPPEVDVLIPTIGRKAYLLDFLNDLAAQTLMPKRVIVVEQNPEPNSSSALDYLQDTWPFEIEHVFTPDTGACQARNKGLDKATSHWIFLADDDIRIPAHFLEQAFDRITAHGAENYNFCCLQQGQKPVFHHEHQTSIFGAGCSMVTRRSVGESRFDLAFEFGFSEDLEFGRQLLDKGFDTIYLPEPQVLHIKAPMGGFRMKVTRIWDNDPVSPKPSPTVMLYKLRHHTREQLLGYRTLLTLKFYRLQSIRNPLRYLSDFNKRWARSIHYANILNTRMP